MEQEILKKLNELFDSLKNEAENEETSVQTKLDMFNDNVAQNLDNLCDRLSDLKKIIDLLISDCGKFKTSIDEHINEVIDELNN